LSTSQSRALSTSHGICIEKELKEDLLLPHRESLEGILPDCRTNP
jgi:hypothetical protein